jgi:hypothetical protein
VAFIFAESKEQWAKHRGEEYGNILGINPEILFVILL